MPSPEVQMKVEPKPEPILVAGLHGTSMASMAGGGPKAPCTLHWFVLVTVHSSLDISDTSMGQLVAVNRPSTTAVQNSDSEGIGKFMFRHDNQISYVHPYLFYDYQVTTGLTLRCHARSFKLP